VARDRINRDSVRIGLGNFARRRAPTIATVRVCSALCVCDIRVRQAKHGGFVYEVETFADSYARDLLFGASS
jgi:hypothetical protein